LGHGWGRGVGKQASKQASKALLSLSGEELERGKYGGAPLLCCWRELVLRSRNHVAAPSSLRSLHLRCISCYAGTLGLLWHASRASGKRKMARGWGQAPPRHSCNSHKPTSKTRWRDPRCVANNEHGSMGSWEKPWVSMGARGGTRGGSKLVNHMDSRSRD
jgi:hypothetical protein